MKVYDVWCSDPEHYQDVEGWGTVYSEDLEDLAGFMEDHFPESDWIIIENELPF